ncbi:MAG: carbon starvation protein A, partial [Fibrobacter sp.]|nr:carbon starvation protein A [Fibrobacter sp.]
MNTLWLLLLTVGFLLIAYRFYSRFIAKSIGEEVGRKTPAVEYEDGLDYCPTKSSVVFGHHFASIAG